MAAHLQDADRVIAPQPHRKNDPAEPTLCPELREQMGRQQLSNLPAFSQVLDFI